MTRAPVGAAQAGRGVPGRRRDRRLHHAGLAAGQPADAEGVDGLARRGQRAARRRSYGISRERQDAFAARSHQLADAAWDVGLLRRPRRRRSRPTSTRDEGIRPGHHRRDAGRAQAVVPAGRHDHRRQRLPAQRRRLRGAARLGGRRPRRIGLEPHRPDRRPRRARAGAAGVRLRPGRGRQPGARPGRHRLGRRRRGRAQRGLRRAVAGLPRRAGTIDPEIVNTRGGAIAIGHPLGASGGRILGTLAKVLRESGAALGRRRDLHRRRPGPGRRPRERRTRRADR